MQTLDFDQTVESIIESDDRFAAESYYFLRDALDVTHRELKKRHGQDHQAQHVSGRQLLEGIRQHALEEFGPMSLTVLTEWGITRCEDFGEIVFQYGGAQIAFQNRRRLPRGFPSIYTFKEAFERPFRPQKPRSVESGFSKGLKKPGTKV